MTLKDQIAEAQAKQATAAQAMKRIGDECRANPPDQMPENFLAAKKDLEDANKTITRLRGIEAAASEGDEASRHIEEPVRGAARAPSNEAAAEERFEPRAPRTPRSGRNHGNVPASPVDRKTHRQAFDTFVRGGATRFQIEHAGLPGNVRNALMTSSGELGGFLVPPDFRTELLMDTAGQSVIMSLARRIPTSTNEATFPTLQSSTTSARIYRTGFRGEFRSENELGVPGTALTPQNQPKFGQKNIPVHSWMPDPVLFTPEMLEDSAINVESILSDVISEQLALEMDSMCLVSGTGSGEPRSIINDTNITVITATAAATIDYNAWIDLIFGSTGLPTQYRPGATIVMNTATYAATLKLNDGADRPLINVFTAPDTIYGYPIVFSEFLAVPASSAKVAIFGNFANYGVAERVDLRIQRLDQTYAPNVAFLARARYGGDTLRSAAFRILKCAA